MKILFIAPRFHTNQYSLVEKLFKEGHDVKFYVMGIGNSEDYRDLTPTLIPVSLFTKLYLRYFKGRSEIDVFDYTRFALPSFRKYYKEIKAINADKIIVRVGSYPYFLLLLPLVFLFRKRFLYYSQHPKYQNVRNWKRQLFNRIVSFNYMVPWYTPVLHYGNISKNKINNHYLHYIPFFSNSNRSYKDLISSSNEKVRFLCVAKYENRKGIENLISAANLIRNNGYIFSLTIVGSTGNLKRENYYLKLKAKVDNLKLNDVIELEKNVPYFNMGHYYKRNQVFILPSTNEPASVSQMEAMSYGLAIICTEDNGTAHYIKHGKNGLVIKPNIKSIEIAMEYYLKSQDILLNHQIKSLSIIDHDFSIDNTYKLFMDLL